MTLGRGVKGPLTTLGAGRDPSESCILPQTFVRPESFSDHSPEDRKNQQRPDQKQLSKGPGSWALAGIRASTSRQIA